MGEEYIGIKFSVLFNNEKIEKNSTIAKLREWGKIFSDLGMTPLGGEGNLSFRTKRGFIITATASQLGRLFNEDFVEVIDLDYHEKCVTVNGIKEPSSETFMHHAIYSQKNEINTIFHTHDKVILDNYESLRLEITKNERDYGSLELVEEILKLSKNYDYFCIKNHGIISMGECPEIAGNRMIFFHNIAMDINN